VASLGLVGASCAVFFALVLAALTDAYCSDDCSTTPSVLQLGIAIAGLVPALVALVQSVRERGRPWRWMLAAAFVYCVWGAFLLILIG
jgi:hypothetical protein